MLLLLKSAVFSKSISTAKMQTPMIRFSSPLTITTMIRSVSATNAKLSIKRKNVPAVLFSALSMQLQKMSVKIIPMSFSQLLLMLPLSNPEKLRLTKILLSVTLPFVWTMHVHLKTKKAKSILISLNVCKAGSRAGHLSMSGIMQVTLPMV